MFGFVSRCGQLWTLVIHALESREPPSTTWVRVFALESRKWQRRAAVVASGVTERNPSVRGTTVTTATRAARYGLAHWLFRELARGRSAHFC